MATPWRSEEERAEYYEKQGAKNKFEKALDRIKKNVEIQDNWMEEDFEHYNTIVFALEIASRLYKANSPETDGEEVKCIDCEYLELELPYGVCGKGYRGIVSPDDSCGKGKRKERGADNGNPVDK